MAEIKITREIALDRFTKQLITLQTEHTEVQEIVSYPINTFLGIQRAINSIEKGTAIWQHTPTWHTACIYIKKGEGFKYNRDLLNLIASGVETVNDFLFAWKMMNGNEDRGFMPTTRRSKTSNIRKGQASYIVADFNKGENVNSLLGSLTKNIPHRTHLISAQVTGIERHKGLLIDYDGWLNSIEMNAFETEMLKRTNESDLIWTANIWKSVDGLHWRYVMYNPDYTVYEKKEWIDDRWHYLWYYDKYQKNDKIV